MSCNFGCVISTHLSKSGLEIVIFPVYEGRFVFLCPELSLDESEGEIVSSLQLLVQLSSSANSHSIP